MLPGHFIRTQCRPWSRILGTVAALLLTLASAPLTAAPAPEEMTVNEVEQGSLLIRGADDQQLLAAPLVDTDVSMTITALIARVTVTQTFRNTAGEWVNGVYVFPLPERSAVDRLRMRIGERTIEGRVQARKKAREMFEKARDAGRKATLVEQQRPNLFTNSVANIGPGEQVVVTIEYQQTLDYEAGWFSLRFPLTTGIRYIPGSAPIGGFDGGGWSFNTDQVPDASSVTPPVTGPGEGHDNPVAIRAVINAGMPLETIESAYHAIRRREIAPGHYEVELDAGSVPGDRDFELRFRPAPGHAPRAAFFRQDVGGEAYGLLMVVPPEAEWARQVAAPREIIYVIDTSGSMHGTSIEQARRALDYGLDRLHARDRFNVVQFNSTTSAFSRQPVSATAQNVAQARRYVAGLNADGGTEMATALTHVLNGSDASEYVRQVVFITDGSVGNEAALFKLIEQRLGASRLFTVGIGSAPNSYFMREAATVGHGTFTYIGDVGEVQERMRTLFEKLEFPVLSNLGVQALDASGRALPSAQLELWPNPLRDLHVHEPIIANLRFDEVAALKLSGTLGGKPWQTRIPVNAGGLASGLNVAWARQKIASLERSLSRGASHEDVAGAIESLGLKHHIVTKYTSLVAIDTTPSRPANVGAKDAHVPSKLPQGWQMKTPAARMNLPQTATPMFLYLVYGLSLLLPAGWLGCRRHVR